MRAVLYCRVSPDDHPQNHQGTEAVTPAGDCTIAMRRDCFEPGSALGSPAVPCETTDANPDAFDFFVDFDIEILRSVDSGVPACAAPPKPHLSHKADGAGSRSAQGARM